MSHIVLNLRGLQMHYAYICELRRVFPHMDQTHKTHLAVRWPEASVWRWVSCWWRWHRCPVPPAAPAEASSRRADADMSARSHISRCTPRTADRSWARRSRSSRSPARGPSRRSPWAEACTGAALRRRTARIGSPRPPHLTSGRTRPGRMSCKVRGDGNPWLRPGACVGVGVWRRAAQSAALWWTVLWAASLSFT